MEIFDKQWWSEVLSLNEVSNADVISRVVTGFELIPTEHGFKNSYKTKKGKATIELAKGIHRWIKDNFPENRISIKFEKTYGTITLSERSLDESPPIEFEQDDYQDYTLQNRHKIEKAAYFFNLPVSDMEYAFNAGREVVLSDDIWSKLENSKSYKIKTLDEAIQHALKLGIDPKPYIDFIKEGKEMPLPLILCYSQDKYYLVGGEVVLSLYKALGSIPTVLQGTLNLKINQAQEQLNEGNNPVNSDIIKEFIKYAVNRLGINKLPGGLILSYNNDEAKNRHSFGTFDPNNSKIWLYVKNRNMADILRTLAHELVHRKQDEDGRIDYNSGETGSEIENEANAQAGVLLRDFGKQNDIIYEGIYGDHLFGDKESGVSIGWYEDEVEEDTPAEKVLFNFMKKYADSEIDTYSNINLDPYLDLFKILKKQYPEIADANISPDTYLYRGTSISRKQINSLDVKEDEIEPYSQGYIIPNQEYKSKRQIQSWSTSYFIASGFAFVNQEKRGGHAVIMRAKAKDMELFFNPKFMSKLSTQLEDETFNVTNPITVDIMVVKDHKDEFEDIENEYLHNK